MDVFCSRIADILDLETVHPSDVLRNLPDWDSLSVLSVLAMADAEYGVTLRAEDMAQANTVEELWLRVASQRK